MQNNENISKQIKQEILYLVLSDPELKLKFSPKQLNIISSYIIEKLYKVINVSKNVRNYGLLKSILESYYVKIKKMLFELYDILERKDFLEMDDMLGLMIEFLKKHKL